MRRHLVCHLSSAGSGLVSRDASRTSLRALLTVTEATRPDVVVRLDALRREVEACTRCPLHETRTQAVFGEGDAGARLMFVGEAPGYHEDKQGRPFVGAAGKMLDELLASIGLSREQVFIANVLKSRPPGNRDPQPDEIAACRPYLEAQIALIRPVVICSLGNFATKLLSGAQSGITKVHGVPQTREVGGHRFHLYPIFHPAAALYTPAMLETLRADVYRLPQLLTEPLPQPGAGSGGDGPPHPSVGRQADPIGQAPPGAGGAGGRDESAVALPPAGGATMGADAAAAEEDQLGLF
ncbi:MAG: uracil-DNA glycosylase [Actinobacteria bacterium]|nr:uracil-DNA glycosylase [Actinomycetota bacterium]